MLGKLIAFEGIDGSGKSTQVAMLASYLRANGVPVVTSHSDSRPKKEHSDALSRCLYRATDLAARMHNVIEPALAAGAVVIMDRYIYTAYAREAVRGVDPVYLRTLYSFAPVPDLTVYFDVPPAEAARRIIAGRGKFRHHEAGLDINPLMNAHSSFLKLQKRVRKRYADLITEFAITRLDGTESPEQTHFAIRELIQPLELMPTVTN